MISYIALLFLMSNVLLLVQSACTEGFMDLSLLKRKAADPHSSLTTLAEDSKATRWIITDANNTFTCNNVRITGFIIGVDIRTETNIRNKYPSIDIWHENSEASGTQYNRVQSIPIILSPDNFTTNGTYRYVLSEPVYVFNGDMLGVYQPKDSQSIIRFYRVRANRTTQVVRIKNNKITKSSISIPNHIHQYKDWINVTMIHPIIGNIHYSINQSIF